MTDAELERLRDGIYRLARVVVDEAARSRSGRSKETGIEK